MYVFVFVLPISRAERRHTVAGTAVSARLSPSVGISMALHVAAGTATSSVLLKFVVVGGWSSRCCFSGYRTLRTCAMEMRIRLSHLQASLSPRSLTMYGIDNRRRPRLSRAIISLNAGRHKPGLPPTLASLGWVGGSLAWLSRLARMQVSA